MTTGAGSGFPLTRLAATVNKVQNDGRILSNRRAMDVIWQRVQQLAERIDLNEAPERMAIIQKLWVEYREARQNNEMVQATILSRKIDDQFEAAYHDYAAWKQMFEALELHSKMTESEVKIMKDLHAIMTAEQANDMMAKVMAVFLRVLQGDAKKLKQAQYELSRLVGFTIDAEFDPGLRDGSAEGGGEPGPGELDRAELLYSGDERPSSEADGLSQGCDPGSDQSG